LILEKIIELGSANPVPILENLCLEVGDGGGEVVKLYWFSLYSVLVRILLYGGRGIIHLHLVL